MTAEEIVASLSGTYQGTVDFPELGLSGPAVALINTDAHSFVLAVNKVGYPGRITATPTGGYIAVTIMFEIGKQPANVLPPILSLRARRTANGLRLTNVAAEKRRFSFSGKSVKLEDPVQN